ncbi:ribonuclease R [Arcticibacterium luteifluviistationis]|uniref:Ribonuclease R n=1 Tax=Arcticibacterium luteifluviistationis TaxID=1784714 RepID=A0A2Z4GFE9_9BACT|nr:ribonuclease R [Arcticibacterium luteifluviistationis]AWV99775.1 ribonuclease R [Arcticibacterium luteifluviistationis]
MARKKKSEITKQKDAILGFMRQFDQRPVTFTDYYNQFDIYTDQDKMFFKLIIEELEDEGKISRIARGKFTLSDAKKKNEANGIIGVLDHVNPKFGFVRYDDGEKDIFIESENLNGAIHGDTVSVVITGRGSRKGGNPEGKVIGIEKRGKSEIVGKIKVYDNYAIVKPDNKNFHEDVFIAKTSIFHAETNDLVIVKIVEYPSSFQQATGKVIEVLGQSGDNDAEMHAIMAEFGLPIKFPEEVETLAAAIPIEIEEEEIKKRRDMRDTLTFTVDPHDAKDFDDALSYKKIDENTFEIGIHIADVSHYVRPGTVLEEEAFKRATSVYLVDRTIPMLPEKLSNNLCSLRPNEDKLVFSAVFEMDLNGTVKKEWFGRCIIHSDKRYAYEQAQDVIESDENNIPEGSNAELRDCLILLNNTAKKLRKERFKKGAFNFETNEVKFELDENGKPLGVYQKVRKDAHKLIEEFMLLANKKVAEFVFWGKFSAKVKAEVKKNEEKTPTMVYRVHEPPNPEKVSTFTAFAGKLGFKINSNSQDALSNSLNNLMAEIEGTPMQSVLESLAIRTMSKAKYSTSPQGHFGLAFEHYSHFTSPIRRYPDVMAHRMLQHYLDNGASLSKDDYESKCKHSSDQEKLAAEAERASIKYKQVEFMSYQDRNVVFEGVVTGVTDFGIFVEVAGTGCEGMVRLADLNDDYYDYDPENYRVTGQRNGRVIGFGDAVKVSIMSTDLEKRSMDLELVEAGGKSFLNTSGGKKFSKGRSSRGGGSKSRKVIPPRKGGKRRKR